ncbi:phosphotransferase [Arthrobacter sp. TMN-50]
MAMHEDEVSIDAEIARRLVYENFPQFHSDDVEPFDSMGTVNAIFRVGQGAAARFPLRATDPVVATEWLRREVDAALEFAASCPFPTPRPIGLGRPGQSYPMPFVMQTWLEGDTATPTGLGDSDAFAGDIELLLSSLRAADTHGRTFTGEGRGGVIDDHDDWMRTCFSRSGGLVDVPVLSSMWRTFRGLPPARSAVMSHKDLNPANILVRGDRIVGILDAGGFGPADPALDLVAAWHLLDDDRRGHVRSRLQITMEEWLRGAAWAFVQAMGLVWYYKETNPMMNALGRNTLQRLIEDSSTPR